MSKLVKTESVVTAAVIGSDGGEEVEDDPKKLGSVLIKELLGNTSSSSSSKVVVRSCQADTCGTDLAVSSKAYHRRHKVCEVHAKAQAVFVAGIRQRFCQQCSRFHEVAEFDESKRSCRRRLAGHNERRRKSPSASATATVGSQHQGQDISSSNKTGTVCARVDDNGRFYSSLPDKHFDIR